MLQVVNNYIHFLVEPEEAGPAINFQTPGKMYLSMSQESFCVLNGYVHLLWQTSMRLDESTNRPVARISKEGVSSFEKWTFVVLRCVWQQTFLEPPPKKGGLGVLSQKILKIEMVLDAHWCILLSEI